MNATTLGIFDGTAPFYPLLLITETCLVKLEFVPTATGRVSVDCPQIGSFFQTTVHQCARHCCATEGCNAFNHVIVNDGGCYLKKCTDNLMLISHAREITILAFHDII